MTVTVPGPVARRRGRRSALPILLLALGVLGTLTACGVQVDYGPKPTLAGANTGLQVVPSFYGAVVADGTGRVLYQFDGDKNGQSACYGSCAQTWRPYIATGEPGPSYPNLNALEDQKIDLVPRQDGQQQVSYNGKPLYFFAGDQRPSDVTGAGLQQFGGRWFALSNSGKRVLP